MADPASVPRPPVRFYRMAAVEDRLDAMAGELESLRRRVAELEAQPRLRPIGLPAREGLNIADEVAMVLGTEDRS